VAKTIPNAEHVTLEGADHFDIPSITQCLDVTASFINSAG
jgi:hypothetical protein